MCAGLDFAIKCLFFIASASLWPAEAFHATIESAVDRALRFNRSILSSQALVDSSVIGIRQAESEFEYKIHPIVETGYGGGVIEGTGYKYGGGLSFSKKLFSGTTVSIVPRVFATSERWCTDINASLKQPILRGFGREVTMSKLFASQFAYRTALRAHAINEVKVLLQVVGALYEVVKQEKLCTYAKESYAELKQIAEAAEIKEKIGLCDGSDVLRVEIAMKQSEEECVKAEEREKEALDQLRLLLALPMETPIQVDVPLVYQHLQIDVASAVEEATTRRIEVKQAIDKYKETIRNARVAKKQLLPDLNLVVNYVNQGCDESFTASAIQCCSGTAWGVGVTSNGFSDYNTNCLAYQQAELTLITASRDIEQVRDTVASEVKKQIYQLEKTEKSILLQEEQIHMAEQKLELARVKFNHGLVGTFDLVEPRKKIRKTEGDLLAAIVDHILAEYRLSAAMGLMFDESCLD